MERKKNYIGFARVSTQAQDLTAQVKSLDKFGCSQIFEGKHSGTEQLNKDALEQLIDYVRAGDVVVVTKLDRLGRSFGQVLLTLERLRKKQVSLIALHQNIDTSKNDISSKLTTYLFGLFAEIEREFILIRTREGKEVSGNWGGRNHKLSIEQRNEIRLRLGNGESKNKLAKEFKVSRATVLNIERAQQ